MVIKLGRTLAILVCCVAAALICGCSTARGVYYGLKPLPGTETLSEQAPVRYAPGAEAFARLVERELPGALNRVNTLLPATSDERLRIYVFADEYGFAAATGRPDVRAMATYRGIMLNPRILERPERLGPILAHEVMHERMIGRMGTMRFRHLPFWFKEGVAAYVSGGGGTGDVDDASALAAFREGRGFEPGWGGVFDKYPSDFGLTPHMFYRQAMMFAAYLDAHPPGGLRDILRRLVKGEGLREAVEGASGEAPDSLWDGFRALNSF